MPVHFGILSCNKQKEKKEKKIVLFETYKFPEALFFFFFKITIKYKNISKQFIDITFQRKIVYFMFPPPDRNRDGDFILQTVCTMPFFPSQISSLIS